MVKLCTVPSCQSAHRCLGYCNRHYKIFRKYGDANYRIRSPEEHNLKDTSEYRAWNHANQRCTNPNDQRYKDYGARGIKVCERWAKSFLAFYEDMGPKSSPKLTLDRIDVNGDYEPGNCRWTDYTIQARNKTTPSTNKSGFKGVHWEKKSHKWRATIGLHYKQVILGNFSSKELAIEARQTAEAELWGQNVCTT